MNKAQFPCGNGRREFVWEMGAGFAGLALSSLLSEDGFFGRHLNASEVSSVAGPLAPKQPHFPTGIKSCIFLMMKWMIG